MKTFTPFWIDHDDNLENDPYTSDCTSPTNFNTPHAYADITIHNGKLHSKVCIEKAPGKNPVRNRLLVRAWLGSTRLKIDGQPNEMKISIFELGCVHNVQ